MTNEFLNDYDEKVIALAQHLGIDLEPDFNEEDYPTDEYTPEEIEEARTDAIADVTSELDSIVNTYGDTYSYYREEYLVLTDEEADDEWDDALENYIDEVIMSEIPECYQNYFDREAWKKDAEYDGRGHSLSSYDGEENEEEVNGTTYYIYRQS